MDCAWTIWWPESSLRSQCGEAREPRRRLEPDVQRHIATPAVSDRYKVRILPRDLETEAGSLISVWHVDVAAQAYAERAGALNADLQEGRLKQAADAEGPKAIGRQKKGAISLCTRKDRLNSPRKEAPSSTFSVPIG
jgi:hypothetical protein